MGNSDPDWRIAIWADESGAVSVDWVVISAALVGLSAATIGVLRPSATDFAISTANMIASVAGGAEPTTTEPAISPYKLQCLDADAEASWAATFAAMTDAQLHAQVDLRHTQFTTHLDARQWSQALQRIDYYHLITQELSARGQPFPAGYPNTETLFQMYNDARA